MSKFKKQFLKVLGLGLSLVLALFISINTPTASSDRTEILWDSWGVPHIYGKDAEGLFQAFGWAQMQSHGDLILRLYGQARGRAAEYWGEKYLESDKYVRTMGIPRRASDWYKAQNPMMRGYLDAFATGINTYAKEHADQISDEVERVLPVDGVDVLAHVQRVIHFTFVVDPERVGSLSSRPSSAGSNGWAIAPSHSVSGNAMLLANPHLPWSDLFLWYEAQLSAPNIDAYGAALVGMPMLAIAFNNHLGWTSTVNTHDGWDAYELTLADGGYRFDGRVRPFENETQILKVKQADGSQREEQLVVQRSIHGPIVGRKDGKAIALRVVGLDKPNITEQFWDMARATNLREFETALKHLQLPMFTILYADRQGHILHLFNGQVPVHSQGDWKYWQGIVPGNTSATLWTKTHPYRDLPRVLDPPSGWLQNANDPPWTTTFPQVLNPNDYPPYIAPRFMHLRAQRSARLLMEEKISFSTMITNKFSSRLELADRVLEDLIPAARQLGGKLGNQAADVLEAWDRKADANSRGAVLFAVWARSMPTSNWFATPWNENSPLTTPNGLADPAGAVKVLGAAATTVKLLYGSLAVPWGEVARLRYGNVDLPASGGPGLFGIFRVIDLTPSSAGGGFQQVAGDTYIAAIEFSNPVQAKVLTTYGNATQPGSPHTGDQLPLYTRNELRSVWRTRKEIEAHLEARKVF